MTRFRVSPAIMIAAVVAVVAIGFLMMRSSPGSQTSTPPPAVESTDTPSVTELADLDTAEEFVANTGIEERLDTSELDAALEGN